MINFSGGISSKEALRYALQSPNILEGYISYSAFDASCCTNNCRLFSLGTLQGYIVPRYHIDINLKQISGSWFRISL